MSRLARRIAACALLAALPLAAACSGSPADDTATEGQPSNAVGTTPSTPASQSPPTSGQPVTPPSSPTTSPASPQPEAVTVTTLPDGMELTDSRVVAGDLDVPWGVGFFPDETALVSERDTGRLLRITPSGKVTPLGTVPGVTPTSEGGLLGVAISPTYAEDSTVFVYATTETDNRVLSGTVPDLLGGRGTPILTGIPRGDVHNGGRIAFGPDDALYVTTGETGDGDLAPDLDSLGGKILRVNPDGSIPADNPFPNSPVWSYGHRNVQGIAWDATGRLWESEFGSQLWDEVNLIEPGSNYGWPAAEGTAGLDGLTDPYAVFSTFAASPSGLAYADGSLWLGALQGETTWRIPVGSNRLGTPEAVRLAEARTRTVEAAPDGSLWVTTSDTDGRAQAEQGGDRIYAVRP